MKKKLRKGLIGMMCLLSIQMLSGCMGEAFAAPSLDITQVTLSIGETLELEVCDADQEVRWSSSNKKVAAVSRKGVVRAKKKGKAKITAKVGKKKLTCRVKVVNGKSGQNVTLILNARKVTMNRGASYALKALAFPEGAGGRLTWKSSKKSVASVTKNGVIRARKPGKAVISVYAGSKKNKVSCTVVVKKKKGEKALAVLNPVFSQYEQTMEPGSTGGSSEGKSESAGYPLPGTVNMNHSSGSGISGDASTSQAGSAQNTGGGISGPGQWSGNNPTSSED